MLNKCGWSTFKSQPCLVALLSPYGATRGQRVPCFPAICKETHGDKYSDYIQNQGFLFRWPHRKQGHSQLNQIRWWKTFLFFGALLSPLPSVWESGVLIKHSRGAGNGNLLETNADIFTLKIVPCMSGIPLACTWPHSLTAIINPEMLPAWLKFNEEILIACKFGVSYLIRGKLISLLVIRFWIYGNLLYILSMPTHIYTGINMGHIWFYIDLSQ